VVTGLLLQESYGPAQEFLLAGFRPGRVSSPPSPSHARINLRYRLRAGARQRWHVARRTTQRALSSGRQLNQPGVRRHSLPSGEAGRLRGDIADPAAKRREKPSSRTLQYPHRSILPSAPCPRERTKSPVSLGPPAGEPHGALEPLSLTRWNVPPTLIRTGGHDRLEGRSCPHSRARGQPALAYARRGRNAHTMTNAPERGGTALAADSCRQYTGTALR